ncbi:MAG: ABC transporter ATP-binding protein [Bacteroidia bacterium]|nr:ABC transporter ATP-binding protein [Bacteroidia bacterium]
MIIINKLSFGYHAKKLLYKNLDLTLSKGKIYGILGKNGAGKSTLLKNMSGLLFPSSGSITVNGFIPQKREPSFLENIYFIPEEVEVSPLTVIGYLNLFAPFYPEFNRNLFYAYLRDLEIKDHGKLSDLSLGQQKKFIIAFALACNTKLLVLDEPTNGLDIPSKSWFRKLIASVLSEERIIIISTHQVKDLETLIDHVIVVDNGELILNNSMAEISKKLCFKTIHKMDERNPVLYSEESLNGYTVVTENTNDEDTKVNLEHLFNTITQQPVLVKAIFKH